MTNGWSHTAGSALFTCNQTGRYLVVIRGEISLNALLAINAIFSIRATLNGTEVSGSQAHEQANIGLARP